MMRVVCVLALFGLAAAVQAGERAATAQLPAALQAVGGTQQDVVSEAEAHEVRGQWYRRPSLTQYKSFNVTGGTASGTIQMMEGVIGTFRFVQVVPDRQRPGDPSTLVVEGAFGGLEGSIGINAHGGLSFSFQGKAFQETLDFAGLFSQTFRQSYRHW